MEEKAMGIKVMIGPGEGVSGLLLPGRRNPEELRFQMDLWGLRTEGTHFTGRADGKQQNHKDEMAVWCIQRDKGEKNIKETLEPQHGTDVKEGLNNSRRDKADGNEGQLGSAQQGQINVDQMR